MTTRRVGDVYSPEHTQYSESTQYCYKDGVHDLVGNLHEWVADRVDATLPSKLPLPAVVARRIGRNAGNGIFMGGFYSTRNEHGAGCKFVTAAHEPRYHDYSTGFRCCRDAASSIPASFHEKREGGPQ